MDKRLLGLLTFFFFLPVLGLGQAKVKAQETPVSVVKEYTPSIPAASIDLISSDPFNVQ